MQADSPTVLVVDDRTNMLRLIQKVLKQDARVITAERGMEAVRVLETQPVSVVLCDLKMPDLDGLDVLRSMKQLRPEAEFILMTAYGSVATAVDAMRLGAYDYLTKPFEPEVARAVVLRALSRSAATPKPSDDRDLEARHELEVLPGLIGASSAMRDLGRLVRKVAASESTALILGETGTGKERIARAIHSLSARASQRFVAVNAAAIPSELLESELFGYARGSFSGAARDRAGMFEEATKGTLFLDEIGEMRPSLQAKLTRAIEERAVRRVGESRERPVDVRLIAATHRDLSAMVKSGGFREDLWYRLNVALIQVPPLRDRPDDIEPLAHHFLREIAGSMPDRGVQGFSAEALVALRQCSWPGNVRQLRAAVERACVVGSSSLIELRELPPEVLSTSDETLHATDFASLPWQEAMDRARDESARRYLLAVLKRFQGKVSAAAQHAGVERESFYRLLRKHGVRPDESDATVLAED
jgi:two-component system response regulator HydG